MVDFPAAELDGRVDDGVDGLGQHDVAGDGDSLAAAGRDPRRHLAGLGAVQVGDHHARALLREEQRRLRADALARARDDGGLVREQAPREGRRHVARHLRESFGRHIGCGRCVRG